MSFRLTDLDLGEFHTGDPFGTVTAQADEDHFKLHKYIAHPTLEVLNGTLELPDSLSGWFGNRLVTLVDPYQWRSRWQMMPCYRCQWNVGFRYATIGLAPIQKDDVVVETVSFGLTDLRYIFDDHETHGLMSAKDGRTLLRPWDEGFNLREIAGVTMTNEVFRADTEFGTVVGTQGPVTVDEITHRNEQSLEIEFELPSTVTEAIHRAATVSRFFAALVGRSQNIEWMSVYSSSKEKHRNHHRVILGPNDFETFDTSKYVEISHLDTLIHSVRHRTELESVLTRWVELEVNDERRAESRRVAHRNYGNASYQDRLYGAMRIPEWVIPDWHGKRKRAPNKDTDRIALVRANCPDLDSDDLRKMVRLARRLRNFHSHAEDGEAKGMSVESAKELQRIGGNVFLTRIVETVNGLADLFDCGYAINMLDSVSRHPFRHCIRNFEHYVAAVSKANLMDA